MRKVLIAAALALLVACQPTPAPQPPQPVHYDGSFPAFDAANPSTACETACARVSALCGQLPATCPAAFARIEADRLVRKPDGQPFTCACLADVTDATGAAACGVSVAACQ